MTGDRYGRFLIAAEALVLVVILIAGIVAGAVGGKEKKQQNIQKEPETENEISQETSSDVYVQQRITFDSDVEEKIASMTAEEKAAQLFLVTPEIFTHNEQVNVAGAGCQAAIQNAPVGGMICGRHNFLGTDSAATYMQRLKTYSQERIGMDLFLLTEQAAEGNEAVTDPDYMRETGLNMVLLSVTVPAADATAEDIGTALSGAADAYRQRGVLAVFPFVPDQVMAAEGSTEAAYTSYCSGFAEALANAGAVQMSTGACKLLTDNSEQPLTFAPETAQKLRGEMGYQGLLISANLSDPSIVNAYSPADASVKAILAGADILYQPSDFDAAYQAVLAAINEGTIPEDTLHNALGRILTARKQIAQMQAVTEPEEERTAQNNGNGNTGNQGNTGNAQSTGTSNQNTAGQQQIPETPAETTQPQEQQPVQENPEHTQGTVGEPAANGEEGAVQ